MNVEGIIALGNTVFISHDYILMAHTYFALFCKMYEQDLSQGQDSSPDSALHSTFFF